jgi:hypothetical protein
LIISQAGVAANQFLDGVKDGGYDLDVKVGPLGQGAGQAAARQTSDHPAIWLLAICQALPDFTFRRISLREMAVNRLSAPV